MSLTAGSLDPAVTRAERPVCPWCGGRPTPRGERLSVCGDCGAAQTWPAPSRAELDAAYGGAYRPGSGRFTGPLDAVLRAGRGTLARRIDRLAPDGPVLDVGSGDGALLEALGRVGRTAVGLERDAGPAGSGRLDVRPVELADVHERVGDWAAVVLWHSLEHLPDAPAVPAHAARLLAPGGLLVIAVPNLGSWQARWFGGRWLALDLPRHLWHLTPHALLRALAADGLRVERVSYWRGGQVLFGWLHGLVASLPGHPSLYDAIRRPAARFTPMSPARRVSTLLAGVLLAPAAAVLSLAEVLAGRGGTLLVEARRPVDGERGGA